jgi:hypothetical protein
MSEAEPVVPSTAYPLGLAAGMADCSKATLYRKAAEGRIRLIRRGARTYVEAGELARFLDAETMPFVPGERIIANAGGHRKPPNTAPPSRSPGGGGAGDPL